MTCIFCHSWDQTDSNCGHYLLEGILMPARYLTAALRDREVLGWRGFQYATAENSVSEWSKLDHIGRMANLALSGGWRAA
jgi:hypothetical protein